MIDLSSLNAEQAEAVKDSENNLLILACAGSGKTKTITSKIAYTIETGRLRPYEICAVTFTNRAAKEMRDRVAALLPDIDTTEIVLRTFHSLGGTLLRRFGESVGLSRDFSIYDDDDSLELLLSAVGTEGDDSRARRKKMREVMKCISKAKDLGLTPYSSSLDTVSEDPDFRTYFSQYQSALERTGNVDFADLIMKSVELLDKDENARNYCHRRFKLVMVDEYQDSNREQFNFLRRFVGENTQLVVVGDDDQSIYSFRGAEVENILSFSKDFRNVREIKLEKNYRSTDEILLPAAALIRHNTSRHQKEIVSADGKRGQKPVVMCSSSGRIEAQRVTNIILSDHNFDDTAVLFRTNAQSQVFEMEFMRSGIPYKVVGALKFYDREEVKDGLSFLRLLLNHKDEISFRRIINKPARGLGDKKVDAMVAYNGNMMDGLEAFVSDNPGKSGDGARKFLAAWKSGEKALEENANPGDILYHGLLDTELLSYYNSEKDEAQKKSRLENLSQLVSVLTGEDGEEDSLALESGEERVFSSRDILRSFLENITLDTSVLGKEDPRDKGGVTLITMHNTKGLEYERVFCVGLEQEIIPGRNALEAKEKEEERRILYVAMTRAKKNLYLSYATERLMWGKMQYQSPSSFLFEIPEKMLSGDTELLYKRNRASSSASYSLGTYKSNYTSSWKSSAPISNTPSWAKNLTGLKEKKTEEKKEKKTVEYSVSDAVMSPNHGKGQVTAVDKRDDGRVIVTVVFDSGKKMKFVAGHSDVERI